MFVRGGTGKGTAAQTTPCLESVCEAAILTGASWLDHTVIVGFSEFSRTALINSRGGRDHSLTNACFVLGGGIKGGQAIGASTDVAMEPQAMSLADGSVGDGEVVLPEHITMALLHDLGVDGDPFDLRVEPLKAILKDP